MRTADLAEPPRPSWCHHPQMTEVPTAAGTFTPTQSKRALLCHRENGDLFPSRGDKTLPIPLQRVVKQRVPGCCCREPAATALGQHRPASSSTAARAPVEGEPAPHQPSGGVGAAVTAAQLTQCMSRPNAGLSPGPPQSTSMPRKPTCVTLDTTSMGTTNTTTGVSPSTSFLSPTFHPRADKPNFPEGRGLPKRPSTSHQCHQPRANEASQAQGFARLRPQLSFSRRNSTRVLPRSQSRLPFQGPSEVHAQHGQPPRASTRRDLLGALGWFHPRVQGPALLLVLPPPVPNPGPAATRLRKPLQGRGVRPLAFTQPGSCGTCCGSRTPAATPVLPKRHTLPRVGHAAAAGHRRTQTTAKDR